MTLPAAHDQFHLAALMGAGARLELAAAADLPEDEIEALAQEVDRLAHALDVNDLNTEGRAKIGALAALIDRVALRLADRLARATAAQGRADRLRTAYAVAR